MKDEESPLAASLPDDPVVDAGSSEKYRHRLVGRFLLCVYGADATKVVRSERSWYYSMGALMVAVAILASVGMAALLSNRWPDLPAICVVGGIAWGIGVLLIERSFTSYVERYPSRKKKRITPVPRLLLGVFSGVVVSESIVLVMFSHEVDQQLERYNSQHAVISQNDARIALTADYARIENKKSALEDRITTTLEALEDASNGQACEVQNPDALSEKCKDYALSGQGQTGGEINDSWDRRVAIALREYEQAVAEREAYLVNRISTEYSVLNPEQREACNYTPAQELTQYETERCALDAQVALAGTTDEDTLDNVILNRMIALWSLGERVSPISAVDIEKNFSAPEGSGQNSESEGGQDSANSSTIPEETNVASAETGTDIISLQGKFGRFWHFVLGGLLLLFDLSPILGKIFRGSTYHDELVRAALPPVPQPLPPAPRLDIRYPFELDKQLKQYEDSGSRVGPVLWKLAEGELEEYWADQFSKQRQNPDPVHPVSSAARPKRSPGGVRDDAESEWTRHDTGAASAFEDDSDVESQAQSTDRTSHDFDDERVRDADGADSTPPRRMRETGSRGNRRPTQKFDSSKARGNIETDLQEDDQPEIRPGTLISTSAGDTFRLGKPHGQQGPYFQLREALPYNIERETDHFLAKITRTDLGEDDRKFARMCLEKEEKASALSRFSPHIMDGYSEVEYDKKLDVHFRIIPYYKRGDLDTWMTENPDRTLGQVLDVLDGVLSGLAVAHKAATVHCDIKPANILLRDEDDPIAQASDLSVYPVICDWGDSKVRMRFDSAKTATLRGSFQWAAPELFRNKNAPDEKRSVASDLYSVGAMGRQLLTGRTPREEYAKECRLDITDISDVLRILDSGFEPRPLDVPEVETLDALLRRWQSNDAADRQPTGFRSRRQTMRITKLALVELREVRRQLDPGIVDLPVHQLLYRPSVKNW
ncbi:DUF4407 domain-containing protein [Rhodococcus pyridinivorans]